MRQPGHSRSARTCVVARHPGQWAGGRPSQVPSRRGFRVIGDANQRPARLHQGRRRVPRPVEPVRVEPWRSLRRGQRQHDRIYRRAVAHTAGLHLPAEQAPVQAIDREGQAHRHAIQQIPAQRRHVCRGNVQLRAALERQTAGRQPGPPLGQPTGPLDKVYKGLESRIAGREAQGTSVEPRCRGVPLAVNPFDQPGGQPTPWRMGIVEHAYRMSGQRTRHGGPGNSRTDYCNRVTFPSHDSAYCTTLAIHTEFVCYKITYNLRQSSFKQKMA